MILQGLISNAEIYLEKISLVSYVVVFLGGIMVSFTPCVYPLIPVTAAFIGANSAGSRGRGFLLSFFYVLGIAVTYSFLGAVAALGGRLFGEISTNPWTYLIVGNIFLLLGLSMLDLFVLPIPGFLRSGRPFFKGKRRLAGALLVGASSGFVVGPCTAPVLGAVFAYVATKQNLFFGITLLFAFAFGMGLLLIFVGTFAGAAASLPKSGKWLNIVKKLFAILLIICAEYFIILAGGRFR